MRQRQDLYSTFACFFVLSILAILLFRLPSVQIVQGTVELIFFPFQKTAYAVSTAFAHQDPPDIKKLKEENQNLRKQLVNQQLLLSENQALRDQFEKGQVPAKQLLPVSVIGMHNTTGANLPTEFIIAAGTAQGVTVGSAVISNDMLLGKVQKVSPHRALVYGIHHRDVSFPAKTAKNSVLGVIKGDGDSITLDNVVLSEKLEVGDTVLTKGDVDAKGVGYPPGLLVGKIVSVQKTPSALFQTAEVQTVLDIHHIVTAFVVLSN